jgi:mannosyltransferase
MTLKRLLHPFLLLLVLLLATGLRFYALDRQSLWNDEGTSVAMAQRDLATIARDAAADIHPPLYYVLLSRWVQLLGTGEAAVRSLSALLGVGLVALTYALARLVLGRWPGLAAALLAAVSPFQVYYSQEARMYMLLALLAAGAVLALAHYVARPSSLTLAALALLEAAGLYTHYSFLFLLVAVNLAFLVSLRRGTLRRLVPWVLSQAVVVVLYLPWLPVALRQAGTWPSPAQAPFFTSLVQAWRWLLFGPPIDTHQIGIVLVLLALVALAGLLLLFARPRRAEWPARWPAWLILLWLGLPAALLFALGLYREAYLKFLLVASPAVCLLLARALTPSDADRPAPAKLRLPRRIVQCLVGLSILAVSVVSLRNYYSDPAYARDDYRSIAATIAALGRPGDVILLNAPGQQEVFRYYYRGDLPVRPLPESRPLDKVATEAALASLAPPGGRIFAVLWATEESDPGRFIEGWLDSHTYKALDSWYGNVRLAEYAVPAQTPSAPAVGLDVPLTDAATGDEITLLGYSLLNEQLAAGDIAQISLFWRSDQTPTRRYKVFVHILDEANHIVGQRDSEPGGGALLTTLWTPGVAIADHFGVAIHPATPPGDYRVEVGLYDAETGRRMETADGATQVWLKPLTVDRPSAPAPPAALGLQEAAGAGFGSISLLGYDLYKLGDAPGGPAPVHPGDVLHADLYWRANELPAGDWSVQMSLVDGDGRERVGFTAAPVVAYPTSRWLPGDVWRGQFDIPIPADATPGRYRLRLVLQAPGGTPGEPFLSNPVPIEASP